MTGLTLLIVICMSAVEAQCINLTVTVTSSNDSGAGSLRNAIDLTNNCSGIGLIEFDIPGTGLHRINLSNELPAITRSVKIDGYSQPGSVPNSSGPFEALNARPTIELRGINGRNFGLYYLCSDSTPRVHEVRGLVINGFVSTGIFNSGCDDLTVAGNFIGTNALGSGVPGNVASIGVYVLNASDNVIGGPDPADRNLISGHQLADVAIVGNSTDPQLMAVGNQVTNNFIGSDVNGLMSILNAQQTGLDGVVVIGQGSNPAGSAAAGNLVSNNLISGHTQSGVAVIDTGLVTISANIIGADRTAAAAVQALLAGEQPQPVPDVPGMGNLMAGIRLGNADGRTALPPVDDLPSDDTLMVANALYHNGHGIWIDSGDGHIAMNNSISGNTENGIHSPTLPCPASITCSHPSGRWDTNAVTDNGGLDIDTDDPGPDVSTHEIVSLVDNVYTVNITPGAVFPCELQFFANDICDPSGQGESQTYLGSEMFATCPAQVTFSPDALPLSGPHVTTIMTITDSSESSNCIANQPPVVAISISDQSADEDSPFNFSIAPGSFTDPNGDLLTYTATLSDQTALPAWLAFNAGNQEFSGTPGNSDVAAVEVRVTAVDSSGPASISDDFLITVINSNDAPIAVADVATTVSELPVTIDVLANDQDEDLIHGDQLSIQSVQQPASGTAQIVGGAIVYTSNPGHVGADSFVYTVEDLLGETGMTTVEVTVLSDALFADGFETSP